MTRETAEHVAELAARLAICPTYTVRDGHSHDPQEIRPVPPHIAAREAIALCKVAKAAHKLAERQCCEDIPEARIERAHARHRAQANAILARFGLVGSLQYDPRGWPLAIHANEADAAGWETCGSPREILRVTPEA